MTAPSKHHSSTYRAPDTSLSKKSFYRKPAIACLAMIAMTCSGLNAQQTTAQSDQNQRSQNQQNSSTDQRLQNQEQGQWDKSNSNANQSEQLDQFLASKLILCNNGQIKTARMVQNKSVSENVKKFASQIEQGHQNLNSMLKPMTAAYDIEPITSVDRNSSSSLADAGEGLTIDQQAAELARRTAGSEVADVTNPDTLNDVTRTIQETSLKTVQPQPLQSLFKIVKNAAMIQQTQCKEMFSQYQGYDLDMAYVGSQIAAHQMMVAELKAISDSTDGELKRVAQQGLEVVQQHLKTAQSLSWELEQAKSQGQGQGHQNRRQTDQEVDQVKKSEKSQYSNK